MNKVTFVVIGKNEGENLSRCFRSILAVSDNILFVDSDSSDNSIAVAKESNIKKIIKVKANYGSAALSRSVGAKEVQTEYIQFLDGDMTLEESWIPIALERLEKNRNIAAVHGFKKVFRKNDREYCVLSDNKDWEPDYMQGAFLIKKSIYDQVGGLDSRFCGEEERDLYIRIRAAGFQVWYIHHLMASHYDFKVKGTKYILFSGSGATIWLPLFKAIMDKNLKDYLFVYRRHLIPLVLDILTAFSVFMGITGFLVSAIVLQGIELLYVLLIRRRGYFIAWKVGFLSILKAVKVYNRKIVFSEEKF